MITKEEPLTVTDFNIDAAFQMAWASFFRIGELTYTSTEVKKATLSKTGLTRSNISFTEGHQYAFLHLKQSKTDIEYIGVQIILSATNKQTCHRASLRKLCTQDPRLLNALLFRLQSVVFFCQSVVNILKQSTAPEGLFESNFSNHSFWKRAVQHMADYGMLNERIQKLSRWISNVFRLYFTTKPETLFNFNFNFQKGMLLAVPKALVQKLRPTVISQLWARRQKRRGDTYNPSFNSIKPHRKHRFFRHSLWVRLSARPSKAKPWLESVSSGWLTYSLSI